MVSNASTAHVSPRVIHSMKAGYRRVVKFLGERGANFPLTARAIIVLIGTMYLFLWPIKLEDDIVSSVIASTSLGIVLIGVCSVFASGIFLRRNLAIELVPPKPEGTAQNDFLEASTILQFVLKTNRIRILPFLALDIRVDFDRPGDLLPVFRLSGSAKKEHLITTPTRFPHRGVWVVTRMRFSLADRAGLARYTWTKSIEQELRVAPKSLLESTLPVISSANRPGDLVTDLHNRQGELFDMKAYHPSDGMKRIVWKVFARRGELLSRHPEASMTPEGQVVLFAVTNSHHDQPARELIAYAKKLEAMQLEIFVGCEGMGSQPAARSPETALELLVESAWEADRRSPNETQAELLRFLASAHQGHAHLSLSRVVLFAPSERLSSPQKVADLLAVGDLLANQGIEPVWIISSDTPLDRLSPKKSRSILGSSFAKRATRMFMRPVHQSSASNEFSIKFLENCLTRKWHVIV